MLQHFHTIYVSYLDLLLKKYQNTGNRNITEVKKNQQLKTIYENLKEAIVNIIKEKFSEESEFWKEKVW